MPRARDPKREKARIMWEQSKGTAKLCDIAGTLQLPESTIRAWKNKDNWAKKNERSVPKNKRNAPIPVRSVPKKETPSVEEYIAVAANEALDDDGLNEKQRQFCYYYFRNKNGTQAAIRAGYSPKSAYSMASELLKKPEIKALLQRMSDEVRNRITFDAAELVEYHMRVAFSDITDFVDFGSHKTPKVYNGHVVMMERPDTGAMVPVTRIVNEVTIKSSADVDGQLISEITESDSGVKIKLADRNKSLDFLERYFLVNPLDRHKIDYDAAQLKMQQEKHEHETKKYGGDIEDSDGLLSEFAQVIADVSGVKKDETDGDS